MSYCGRKKKTMGIKIARPGEKNSANPDFRAVMNAHLFDYDSVIDGTLLLSPLSIHFSLRFCRGEDIQKRGSPRTTVASIPPLSLLSVSSQTKFANLGIRARGFVPLYLRQPNGRLTQLTNSGHPNLTGIPVANVLSDPIKTASSAR